MRLVIVDSIEAWHVTIGSTIINGIMVGFTKIYSLIIIQYQDLLDAPMSMLMFGASMLTALVGILGPFSTFLSEKLSTRKSGILAALLATISLVMMAYAYNIYVHITSTALLGVSFSMIYIPTFPVPGKCHKRYQTLSQGIVTSGASFGTLTMPLVISELMNIYSIRGVVLIFAGIIFHFAIGAVLMPLHIIEVREGQKPLLVSTQNSHLCLQNGTVKIENYEVAVNKISSEIKLKLPPRNKWCTLVLYSLGMSNVINGYMLMNGLYGAFARSLYIDVPTSAYVLIIQSSIDFVSRLIIGYSVDRKCISRWVIYCVNASVLCVITLIVGIFPSVLLFYIHAICVAIFGASLMLLNILILIDAMGIEHITTSFPFYIFIQGGSALIVFYAIGCFCDSTGLYNYAVMFGGLKIGLGGLLITSEKFLRMRQSQIINRSKCSKMDA